MRCDMATPMWSKVMREWREQINQEQGAGFGTKAGDFNTTGSETGVLGRAGTLRQGHDCRCVFSLQRIFFLGLGEIIYFTHTA